jgi:hypothetical protein
MSKLFKSTTFTVTEPILRTINEDILRSMTWEITCDENKWDISVIEWNVKVWINTWKISCEIGKIEITDNEFDWVIKLWNNALFLKQLKTSAGTERNPFWVQSKDWIVNICGNCEVDYSKLPGWLETCIINNKYPDNYSIKKRINILTSNEIEVRCWISFDAIITINETWVTIRKNHGYLGE